MNPAFGRTSAGEEVGGGSRDSQPDDRQTKRRVLRGEAGPAGEKVVSLFEEQADIIVKSPRRGITVTRCF